MAQIIGRPKTHGLWEAIAATGALEDALHNRNKESAMRNLRSIERGIDIMLVDLLITVEEASSLKARIKKIAESVNRERWDDPELIFDFWDLHGTLQNLLERLCGRP